MNGIDYRQHRENLERHTITEGPWFDNSIQFPRLLVEIMATQDLNWEALCDSMDLEPEDIDALFERADIEWEAIKNGDRDAY